MVRVHAEEQNILTPKQIFLSTSKIVISKASQRRLQLVDKSVFGGEFDGEIARFSSVPPQEGQPEIAEEDKNLVMHVALPILGGHELMGTDAPQSMGFKVIPGNNMYINLEPDTRVETKRLFDALYKLYLDRNIKI